MKNPVRIYLILGITFFGCVKEIPYKDNPDIPKLPVFHLFIGNDSLVQAECMQSAGVFESVKYIDGSTILAQQNNSAPVPGISGGNGRYLFSGLKFKSGDIFRLDVGISGYSPFGLEGKVPNKTIIEKIDTGRVLIPGLGISYYLDIRFTDSALYDNYYRIQVYKISYKYSLNNQGQRTDSTKSRELISIYSNALPVAENNFNNYSSREILFSDATVNGVQNTLRIHTTEKLMPASKEKPLMLEIHLQNVEKTLYQYFNTRNAHIWQQQSISQVPGAVIGNLPGTLGVAGAYSEDVKMIQLK